MEAPIARPAGAVYFPYINVPANDWFIRTVLYWDEVACIVPPGYQPNAHRRGQGNRLSRADRRTPVERYDYTRRLESLGLVRVLRPDLPPDTVWPFVQDFLRLVEHDPQRDQRHHWAASGGKGIDIHVGKLGYLLAQHLAHVGLARDPEGEWVRLEPETARLFMACFASYLGDTQRIRLRPVTDDQASYAAMKRIFTPLDRLAGAGARDAILRDVLPAPVASDVSLHDVARFKDRHGDELHKFRRHIEAHVRRINSIADSALRAAETEEVARDIAEEITELRELMTGQGWKRLRSGTLEALTLIPSSALVLTGHADAAAAAGLAPVLRIAYRLFRPSGNESVADGALAYAVSAGRALA